jgi:hypothetical protein
MLSLIAATAFGDQPGRWPLPPAREPHDLWLRAVAAGGQGRYASANADLSQLLAGRAGCRLMSLALSTRASFLRQLGWHWRAHDVDGPAWARSGDDPEAAADALIGLAADALGVGRLALSSALLSRAAGFVGSHPAPPQRLHIRLAWVRAELAMASGDGHAAIAHARHGVELAQSVHPAPRRHQVKSDVVLAAALCCAGDLSASRRVADSALAAADADGLVPLRWALACLLADIGSAAHGPDAIVEVRDRSAAFVTRHGGRWNRR